MRQTLLASISGLLCLSEIAGSGEGLTRAARWGRDRPLPQPREPPGSRAYPPARHPRQTRGLWPREKPLTAACDGPQARSPARPS